MIDWEKAWKISGLHPGTEDTVEYVDESHAHNMWSTGNKNDRGTRYLGKDLK